MTNDSNYSPLKVIQKLFTQKSLLDITLEVEKFLDFMNLYVYKFWFDGIIADGPTVDRYWITVILKYDYKKMPDPLGARVLHDVGVKVTYEEGVIMEPVDVKKPSDYRPGTKKPKLLPKKVWYITLKIPRRFIDDIDYNEVELDDEEMDVESVEDAVTQTDQEGQTVQDSEGEAPDEQQFSEQPEQGNANAV